MNTEKIIKYLQVTSGILITLVLPITLVFIWFSGDISDEVMFKTYASISLIFIFIKGTEAFLFEPNKEINIEVESQFNPLLNRNHE